MLYFNYKKHTTSSKVVIHYNPANLYQMRCRECGFFGCTNNDLRG